MEQGATPRRSNGGPRRNKPSPRPENNKKKAKNTKQKQKPVSSDYRYLEIAKLLRHYDPITINGIPTTRIKERMETEAAAEAAKEPEPVKKQKSKARSILTDYIHQLMTNHPDTDLHLSFRLKPSDPDFPFDMDTLNFSLCVPESYPYANSSKPSIVVLNDDIPRGFAVNIEHGYKKIVSVAMDKAMVEISDGVLLELADGRGLLSQVKTLDKYLEEFLKQEKRPTVKFIKHKEKEKLPSPVIVKKEKKVVPVRIISPEKISARKSLIQELTGKFGDKVKLFNKGHDGDRFKVQVPLPKEKPFPYLWSLNGVVDVFLHVPVDFPETNASISIPNNFSTNIVVKHQKSLDKDQLAKYVAEAKSTEKKLAANFNRTEPKYKNLVYSVNWLANYVFQLGQDNFAQWYQLLAEVKEQ